MCSCAFCLAGEFIVVKRKLKPVFVGIVVNVVELSEEFPRIVSIVIGIKEIDEASNWVYLACVPRRYVEEASALSAEFFKTLKFFCQL